MRNIQIVAVGRLKEHYLTDGCAEYCKRLSAFGKVRITELEEARLPEQPSEAQIRAALEAEGERIIEKAAGKLPDCAVRRGKAAFLRRTGQNSRSA